MDRDVLSYLGETLHSIVFGSFFQQAGKFLVACILAAFGDPMRPVSTGVFILFCLDFLLGFFTAVLQKKISNRKMYYGLIKLLIYLVVLSASTQIKNAVPLIGLVVGSVMDSYVLMTEGASVLKNASQLATAIGVSLPGISRLADFLQEKAEKEVEEVTKEVK